MTYRISIGKNPRFFQIFEKLGFSYGCNLQMQAGVRGNLPKGK